MRVKIGAAVFAIALVGAACSETKQLPTPQRIIASGGPVARTSATPKPSATPVGRSIGTVSVPETPSPQPSTDLSKARVQLTQVASLNAPLAMAFRKGDTSLYVAEKGGTIRRLSGSSVSGPVLDISSEVSSGSEQGLLGLAFSPDGTKLYVDFTDRNGPAGNTIVREYAFTAGVADTSTARQILEVTQPEANHNGGNILFGPDGHLYVGLGDGGGAGDQHGTQGNGQNRNTLLGKLLRIDPGGNAAHACPGSVGSYGVPADNPFGGACDAIWAYGLRNPWRFSFDSKTHDLLIADVGQDKWEEIDFQRASSSGGENYGWRLREGFHAYSGAPPPGNVDPIYEYSHADGNCSITGGYVYRGTRIADLVGAYVFGDFCAGRLQALVAGPGSARNHRFLGPHVSELSSFGQDQSGNLYVLSLGGTVYRLDPA